MAFVLSYIWRSWMVLIQRKLETDKTVVHYVTQDFFVVTCVL